MIVILFQTSYKYITHPKKHLVEILTMNIKLFQELLKDDIYSKI